MTTQETIPTVFDYDAYRDLGGFPLEVEPVSDVEKAHLIERMQPYDVELQKCVGNLRMLDATSSVLAAMTQKDRDTYALLVDYYVGDSSIRGGFLHNRSRVVALDDENYSFASAEDLVDYKAKITEFLQMVDRIGVARDCSASVAERFTKIRSRYNSARHDALIADFTLDLDGNRPRLISGEQKKALAKAALVGAAGFEPATN